MKRLLLVLAAGLALTAPPVRADDPAVPGGSYPASRYEALWTKSPFAVATSEVADASPDYFLVGIAKVDGVSYASVVETKTPQEHFLISSDKPVRGLTLTSINRSADGSDTYAVVQKDGQSITLRLQQLPATAVVPGMPPVPVTVPVSTATPLPMPGASLPSPPGSPRLFPRFHRPIINLPPQPAQIQPPPPPSQ